MNLPTEIFDDVIVVHAPEELGTDQGGNFTAFFASLERNKVVLDVDNTELLDSKGLEALLEVQERMRAVGGDMKIAAANATNRKILEITRLDQHLEVFQSVIDAVKSYH